MDEDGQGGGGLKAARRRPPSSAGGSDDRCGRRWRAGRVGRLHALLPAFTLPFAVTLLFGVLTAPAALAELASGTVDSVERNGYAVEVGAEDVDEGALAAAIDEARANGVELAVAFLAEDPTGGAEFAADALLERVGGTVLVLTPSEVGAAGEGRSNDEVDAALDAALANLGPDGQAVEGVRAFAAALTPTEAGGAADAGGLFEGLGAAPLVLVLVLLLAVVAVVAVVLLRSRRGRRRGGSRGGYRDPGYGGAGRRPPRRGGFGGGLLGGLLGARAARRMGRGGGRPARPPGRPPGGARRPPAEQPPRRRPSAGRAPASGGRGSAAAPRRGGAASGRGGSAARPRPSSGRRPSGPSRGGGSRRR